MLSAAGRPNVIVGSAPEFRGEPDVGAPEELLVGELNTYMMLTFVRARDLSPVRYESKAEGLLEKFEGKYRIAKVTVRPRITLESDAGVDPARQVIESVERPRENVHFVFGGRASIAAVESVWTYRAGCVVG
jgi:hypothetical protein